jgi:hypothetical protein
LIAASDLAGAEEISHDPACFEYFEASQKVVRLTFMILKLARLAGSNLSRLALMCGKMRG